MQTRLKPLDIKRTRKDYPQVNYIDTRGIQHIELNRGCPYQCEYCWADPNFKEFPIPIIKSNKVQIIGEAFLSDSRIPLLINNLGQKRFNNKVIYYGISQGVNKKDLNDHIVTMLSYYRFGLITSRGHWKKGIRISWDGNIFEEKKVKDTIKLLVKRGYKRKDIIVFVLVNWKISYKACLYKLKKFKEWNVMIDDCTFDCSKKKFIPLFWSYKKYKNFRAKCRDHNIRIPRAGYNPEKTK